MIIYPRSAENSRCRLCNAPIAWVLTFPRRNRCPIDRPYEVRNLAYDQDGHATAELVSPTHFATCPNYDRATGKAKPSPKPTPIQQPNLF